VKKFLGLVVLAVVGWAVGVAVVPYGPAQATFVEVRPGTSSAQIAAELQRAGVVRSGYVLLAMKAVQGAMGHSGAGRGEAGHSEVGRGGVGRGDSWKAGEYMFDGPLTPAAVFRKLRRGEVYTVALTIPEGFNVFDIAQAVQAAGLGDAKTFFAAEQAHTELIARWAPGATSLEGYLFPDTYRFSRHATPLQMLSAMVRRFGQQAAKLGLDGAAEPVAQTVTMASLVEKEVHVGGERARVAGVFENRLAAGMPLQTDPAVIYASELRGTWTGVIHQSELHSDSAYNTYAHAGLPPGPICNPGMASLIAAMHPVTSEDLYFVARPDGTTVFARTLAEHAANVREYVRGGK
jgi:UPF0755 protein